MIEMKNITKSFGERKILDNLNISLNKGDILAIVGPSGGGKTTLLRCISGLEKMDEGKILIDEKVVDPMNHSQTGAQIGVVFQDFNLFPHLTVLENLSLSPKLNSKEKNEVIHRQAEKWLSLLDLTGKEQHYPYQLSGGQKQRVAIARALMMNPNVLCYDEPTSALDPDLRDSVADTLLQLKKTGMTQIVVTHDPIFAEKVADQTIQVEPLTNA